MYKKLSQLGDVVSGYTFRVSIENDPKGDVFVLQAKNISVNQDIVHTTDLITISDKLIRSPYFLERNDIVLVSRGSGIGSFRSAVCTIDARNVMPSSSVHVIRIRDITVLPKYISLYLNSLEGQRALDHIVTGASYIQSILVKNLSDLEIPIPPMYIQKLIIALHENSIDQDRIRKRKQEIQKNIINASFTNVIKNYHD
jgi:restriction endonuclease S subunit